MPKKHKMQHWVKIALCLVCWDYITTVFAYMFGLMLRFDFVFSMIPEEYSRKCIIIIPIYGAVLVGAFCIGRLYRSIWRFASLDELVRLVSCNFAAWLLLLLFVTLIPYCRLPISVIVVGGLLQFMCTIAIRFSYRLLNFLRARYSPRSVNGEQDVIVKRVMIIGAGAAGQMLAHDMASARENTDKVSCFIDDNRNKWGRYVEGVRCVGGRNDIFTAVEEYHIDKIVFAIPTADAKDRRDILNICKETGCELTCLPGIFQILNGDVTVSNLRPVAIEDLLGRDTISVNMDEIFHVLTGKVIIVTGGGGSIGSELCRQIAAHNPSKLIIFDVYENNAYDIQQELRKKYPNLDLVVLIGSVRDSARIYGVFRDYKPDICFHAAAHKHVPLMEDSPCEAIKNNVAGTYKTAYAAMACGCSRFILISTDKAVNPTNIMGASKRLCEMLIQTFDRKIKEGKAEELSDSSMFREHPEADSMPILTDRIRTEYVAVRFGNVLGSNGSVVPLFTKQIAEGGPVTVTHPDIIRYFMTIPEAVSLVLQAGVYAKGGEIFVLDMGEPVKIDTLARNLIKLSGLKPDVDIKIVYSGLRPGEKLYEEKLMSEEGIRKTENELIFIGNPLKFDQDCFIRNVSKLIKAAYHNDSSVKAIVKDIVNTYEPQEVI